MEAGTPQEREHLVLHEVAGHYLSSLENSQNLASYIDAPTLDKIKLIEQEFRGQDFTLEDVRERADSELYAEFTAYLLRSQ